MGIIITGLLTLMGLIVRSIQVGTLTKNEFIATALSQEGIEAARAIRDSNGLETESGKRPFEEWSYNLYQCLAPVNNTCPEDSFRDYTAVPELSYDYSDSAACPNKSCITKTVWVFDFTPNAEKDAPVYQYAGSSTTPGLFVQRSAGIEADMETTQFYRLVTLEPLCDNSGVSTPLSEMPSVVIGADGFSDAPGCPTEKIGIRVTSRVTWTDRSKEQDVTLSHDMYDWR